MKIKYTIIIVYFMEQQKHLQEVIYNIHQSIYAQEKYSGANISNVSNGTQIIAGNIDVIAQAKMNPNGK